MRTPCEIWTGARTAGGYGETFRDGKVVYTHRVAWEEAHGPIPAGYDVHHRCRERACRNVEHLELKLHDEHAATKLTRADARAIRALSGRFTHREIAEQFGVSRPLVSLILAGRRWAAA